MRAPGIALALVAAACSVPDKQPLEADDDGGDVDAMPPDAPGDTGAPDTMITEAPAAFSNQSAAIFRFTADEDGATFTCSIDGESPLPCESPYTRSLGDGGHIFAVRATDAAGNADDTPAEHVWTIDTVAPDTSLTEAPPVADNSVIVHFGFDSNEDNVTFDCSLDGNGYVTCESGDEFGPIGDGAHSFAVRAHDRAGNVDASPAIYAWTVDTSTPDTQIVTGPSAAVGTTSASFTFISPDAGGGATFQCSLDGVAFATCSSPETYSNLAEGEHTFQVRVRDSVGNLDPTPATRTWTVDLTPP